MFQEASTTDQEESPQHRPIPHPSTYCTKKRLILVDESISIPSAGRLLSRFIGRLHRALSPITARVSHHLPTGFLKQPLMLQRCYLSCHASWRYSSSLIDLRPQLNAQDLCVLHCYLTKGSADPRTPLPSVVIFVS